MEFRSTPGEFIHEVYRQGAQLKELEVVRDAIKGMLLAFASEDLEICLKCNYAFNNPNHSQECRVTKYVNSLTTLSTIEKRIEEIVQVNAELRHNNTELKFYLDATEKVVEAARMVYESDDSFTEDASETQQNERSERDRVLGEAIAAYDKIVKEI